MSAQQQVQRSSDSAQETASASTDSTVAAGQTARAGRGNAAAASQVDRAQAGRNASDFNDSDGNGTQHAEVGPEDAASGGVADVSPDLDAGEREVRPLYTPDDPLHFNGTPTAQTLYDERPSTGECVDDWQVVSGVRGSTAQPSLMKTRDERTIFVGGQPAPADIHQGEIGDCYFLAAVADVAGGDSGHLRDMFTVSGNQVVVRLFSYDTASTSWTPRNISVDMTFLHASDAHGNIDRLISSGFRMGETPSRAEWYADTSMGSELWVCEDAEFEFALWAPLLEKAYARLTERFGQYGGAHSADANSSTNADGSARSGYEIIDGGFSDFCYGMLYGNAEVSNDSGSIDYAAAASGSDLVAANLPLIERLLSIDGTDLPAGQQSFVTMSTDSGTIVGRLKDQLERTLALQGVGRFASFVRSLQWLAALCGHYQTAEAASDQPGIDAAAADITRACTRMAAPESWPILGSDRDDGAYKDLRDLLAVAQNIGVDASDSRRLTYADHAYSVLGLSLRNAANDPLTLVGADLPARNAEIDPDKSTVRMRNPHGTNEPDANGDGADDGTDDGSFSMPLQQAIRVFSSVEQGVVRT